MAITEADLRLTNETIRDLNVRVAVLERELRDLKELMEAMNFRLQQR